MSYGQQPGGYGRHGLQLGMPVSSDNGWTGTVTEVIPAAPGYDGAVRVAWHGDGTTLVALSMFVVENGQAIVRTQPQPQQDAPQETASPVSPVEDDQQTRLAAPARNDPSHVNPYVSDPPLVTPEPPPIHPTHGGQFQDDDLTYVPPVPRQESAGTAAADDLTYIPPATREAAAEPSSYDAGGLESETAIPAVAPMEAGMTTPIEGMSAGVAEPHVVDATQQEITVPIIEEQVEARPEWRDAGSIVVRTVMDEVPQTLTQETEREELFVERVAVGRELAENEQVAPREEGDVYIIPIVVEEAVVVTRRILAEELRVTKRVIPTTQTVHAVVRKERVEIDAGHLADRVHDGGGTDASTDIPPAARADDPS